MVGRLAALLLAFAAAVRADPLDRDIPKVLLEHHVPGAQIAVVRDGKLALMKGYGVASIEHAAKVTADTRFEIASTSKMFIATAIRQLADAGKLDLDDPVGKYLDHIPASWKPMRIRHLVAMDAGFPEDWDLFPWADVRDDYDDASMVATLAKLPLENPVGTRWHYASPGYALLGIIVTKVTGMPFQRYVAEHLLAPAGMTQTTYNDPAAVIAHRADGYRWSHDTLLRGFYVAPYLHARADVGLLSTARDLARWVIALDAGKIVANPERLYTPFRSDDGAHDLGYGYGWITGVLGGHRAVYHTGGFRTGFQTLLVRFPDDKLAVAINANCTGCGDALRHAVLRDVVPDFIDITVPTGADAHPDATAQLVTALKASRWLPDAVPDAAAMADHIAHAPSFDFVARHDLRHRKLQLQLHGLAVAEVVSLNVGGGVVLACYLDAQGRIVAVEDAD